MIIGGLPVGPGHPVYTIAEIGSNHDGDFGRALALIQLAADSGADCAKFQFFHPDRLYPGERIPGAVEESWLPALKACCHEAGVEFMCSIFDLPTLEAYMAIGPAAVKIASPEALNRPLLREAASYDIPLLVSTGAMTARQVRDLILFLERIDADKAILHCVSAYPPGRDELNITAIGDIPAKIVGFSDHSLEPLAPVLAVACGAHIIEKHFTDDRGRPGADHPHSMLPDEFHLMVEDIRNAETMLGDGVKRVMDSEDPLDRREAA